LKENEVKFLQIMCSVRFKGQYIGTLYGPGNGPIWMSNVACSGRETHFMDCRHNEWGRHNCYHTQDVSISCLDDSSTHRAGDKCDKMSSYFFLCVMQLPEVSLS